MSLSFSAATVKSWFQYRCDRKTRYETMSPQERDAVPILKDEEVDLWAEEGVAFERAVVRRLANQTSVLLPGPGADKLEEQLTAAFLRGQKHHEYAHQAVLVGGHELKKLLHTSDDVHFRRTYPDLLQRVCDDPLTFRVIDIKATQVATYFHKAQVAFYALVLSAQLAEIGVPAQIDKEGQIWHLKKGSNGQDGECEKLDFKLKSYLNLVTDFFAKTVPRIEQQEVGPGRDQTFFHLYYKCEQCGYLRHCARAIEGDPASRDVSAVAGLTHEAKRALEHLGMTRVGALARAKGLRAQQSAHSWSLKRQADVLRLRAEAMVAGRGSRLEDRYSYLMPGRADVALYLVVDGDPVQGDLVTVGYLLDWQGELEWSTAVLPTGEPQQELLGLKRVLGKLVGDLRRLHQFNQSRPESERLHGHIFLYEPSEAKDLQRAVGRHLEDPSIRGGLLDLVRLFPPEEVIPEPEYRGHHHLPATAVRSVVEQLYVLPVRVSYDLRQVSAALAEAGLSQYDPQEPFRREFSTRLSIDVVRRLRRGGGDTGAVEADVRARLGCLRELTRWLLAQNAAAPSPFLRLRKRPFAFQAEFDPLGSTDLEILRAYELLASRSGMLAELIRLAQPWEVRRDAMRCMAKLRLVSHRKGRPFAWLRLKVPAESRDAEIGPEDIGLVLTDDDPDIRLDPTRWDAFSVNMAPGEGTAEVGLRMWFQRYDGPEIQRLLLDNPDDNWFVDKVFRDFSTERVVGFLEELGGGS